MVVSKYIKKDENVLYSTYASTSGDWMSREEFDSDLDSIIAKAQKANQAISTIFSELGTIRNLLLYRGGHGDMIDEAYLDDIFENATNT